MTPLAGFPLPSLLAQALADSRVQEVLGWAALVLGIVVVFFIGQHLLRKLFESRVRGHDIPFGVAGGDIKEMEKTGLLSAEEAKAVRAAMARQFVKASEARAAVLMDKPGVTAEELLAKADEPAPRLAPAGKPPLARATPPEQEPLPRELAMLRGKSAEEIEELVRAGFLSDEDARRLRGGCG